MRFISGWIELVLHVARPERVWKQLVKRGFVLDARLGRDNDGQFLAKLVDHLTTDPAGRAAIWRAYCERNEFPVSIGNRLADRRALCADSR